MLYNARPNSIISKLVVQDNHEFVKWTVEAASRGEPRAMFNLAMRMASETPVSGFDQDFETAFILLKMIERINTEHNNVFKSYMPYVSQTQDRISKKFDTVKIETLVQRSKSFDLSSLVQNR